VPPDAAKRGSMTRNAPPLRSAHNGHNHIPSQKNKSPSEAFYHFTAKTSGPCKRASQAPKHFRSKIQLCFRIRASAEVFEFQCCTLHAGVRFERIPIRFLSDHRSLSSRQVESRPLAVSRRSKRRMNMYEVAVGQRHLSASCFLRQQLEQRSLHGIVL
jgi:hypothetical protein